MAAKKPKTERTTKPKPKSNSKSKPTPRAAASPTLVEALAWLDARGSKTRRADMGARYGIHVAKAYGVPMNEMIALAKRIGPNHAFAAELWDSDVYEARITACMVDDPAQVTPAQMDRWCRDFDNWAVCDTACFKLFDRTPHAFGKVVKWAEGRAEFVRRGAFALLASLALHDRTSPDARFLAFLPLIEEGAADERNFVKKAVSWALRSIGRRSPESKVAAAAAARRMADSEVPSERWIGKDALKDLGRATAIRAATTPKRRR